jgi:hypothetical protein
MSFVFAGTPVSSTNKHDCHEITEILLKAALGNNNALCAFPTNEWSFRK